MSWQLAVLHAAECALLVGQVECAGRLLSAETPEEGRDAAERAGYATGAVVNAARAMIRRGCPAREVRLLAEAADDARRAAVSALIECLIEGSRRRSQGAHHA